jgi:hypothetical protein
LCDKRYFAKAGRAVRADKPREARPAWLAATAADFDHLVGGMRRPHKI